ncbi:hypothetical protein MOQ72_31805 [Saccharopolyspora sp. K220]|uniref:hypothetical protein n=1 Tax=Saccharopolyspora soli TaxID=2926618 RepID=UPI001F5AF525|nr:hypothetical protein [Saccharopolyspora soli]MCI2422027.1 hypothetical protein [Saccharopolyspora soli]
MLAVLPDIAAIAAAPAFFLLATYWKTYRPQHAGGGEGALTVWQLIAHVEAERQQRERGGRHRLHESAPDAARETTSRLSTSDNHASEPPPLEVHRRVLDALHHL